MFSTLDGDKEFTISMTSLDAYTISNILADFYGLRHAHVLSNTRYLFRHPNSKLFLFNDDKGIQGTVTNWDLNRDRFPYSIKQLLAYLYDKIESN